MDGKPTVFVVDDDALVRRATSELIQAMLSVRVASFDSGEAFLECYEGEPGVLVTDMQMNGMSGTDLLEILATKDVFLPTVAVSGFAMQCDWPYEPVAVLEKPFAAAKMCAAIRKAFDKLTQDITAAPHQARPPAR